jgi:ribonuclease PH
MIKMGKRIDGRTSTDLRPIEAKAGIIKNAEGSGYFKIGKTWAYAAVYGPKEIKSKIFNET